MPESGLGKCISAEARFSFAARTISKLTILFHRRQDHDVYALRLKRQIEQGVSPQDLEVFDPELFDFNKYENMETEAAMFRSTETAEKLFRCLLGGSQHEAFFYREPNAAQSVFTTDWGFRLMNRTILTLKQEMVQSAIGFNVASLAEGNPVLDKVSHIKPKSSTQDV